MPPVVIENPVLNSPFQEPNRHFRFSDEGITDEVVEQRRISSYFIPIPNPKKKGKQLAFDTEWTEDRIRENETINKIRERVGLWRKEGYVGVTNTTRRLLEYWQRPDRERRLFFCQIEALETAIYVTELAGKRGDSWIDNDLRKFNEAANPGLYRIAFKMATGSGKTVVMGMLIAWQALNRFAAPQDGRFADAFLLVTPGITIRDRLRVLLPNDPGNYYRQFDLVTEAERTELERAKILITNFHGFLPRETVSVGKLTKDVLGGGKSAFTETPEQVVRRVCRDLGAKKGIVVLNDEAHHCYRRKPDGEEVHLKGDERKEAEKRDQEARVWISGLEAVKRKIGIKAIYDLSATPFFLRGSGYPEGTLFNWVVSDFSLIDAIESGIVKVPRVPVSDNSMAGALPTYRDLWVRIREQLPKKGRGTQAVSGEPKLPLELEGALESLYGNYQGYYKLWEQDAGAQARGQTPPVFIVVCNNTNVSKLVFDHISGWENPQPDGSTIVMAGKLDLFRNDQDGRWSPRPNTILVDSEQLESGEGMSDDFRKIAAREIEEFKAEYAVRFPGRSLDDVTDEDLLREVLNTVGKPGKLGEHVKCVVSVSMLTEGWDANTVTHILGVRAFGTQLLCEQVVGRGLRRMTWALDKDGHFEPEYAEVYGVPFSFIPCSGSSAAPKPPKPVTRVRALEERVALEMHFPRLLGYRFDLPNERLTATFTKDSHLILSTKDVPTETLNEPIVGESSVHTLDELRQRRPQEIDFKVAQHLVENFFRDPGQAPKPWLFPQLLGITRRWRAECLACHDDTFPQMLLWTKFASEAANKLYNAIVVGTAGEKVLKPVLYPYDTEGATRYVDFDTTKPTYRTDPERCHISHVVADTGSWEQKLAQTLEDMEEVECYFKNQNVGFTIPYTINGAQHNYYPDFVARVKTGNGPLHMILECTGMKDKEKEAKVLTARDQWVLAVNNHGGFGRWAFQEIRDPWNAKTEIRQLLGV